MYHWWYPAYVSGVTGKRLQLYTAAAYVAPRCRSTVCNIFWLNAHGLLRIEHTQHMVWLVLHAFDTSNQLATNVCSTVLSALVHQYGCTVQNSARL